MNENMNANIKGYTNANIKGYMNANMKEYMNANMNEDSQKICKQEIMQTK